jgi:DNA-binding NarL/FixJ family response regulator
MMARDGLAAQLAQLRPETLVLQARDLTEALRLAAEHADLDAVILAVSAAEDGGLEAIDEFGRARAALPVIVLSASEAAQDARAALARGALGYVPRSAGPRTLLSAIRLVLDGERYVPPLILEEPPGPARPEPQAEAWASRTALTARQTEVLRRLSEGHSNKTIARDLGVAEKTVKAHVTAIFKALNVANRAQATAAGRRAGFV